MKIAFCAAALAAAGVSLSATAQAPQPVQQSAPVAPAPTAVAPGAPSATAALPAAAAPMAAAPTRVTLPADTLLQVASVNEISSINMKIGDTHKLQVAADVAYNGAIVIPRGAPVLGTVTYRTGKGIGGKSAKFELTFSTVTVNGTAYKLKGKHRQEGRGNTVGALLGSIFISGKSAVITSGQVLTAFTDEPIPVS